MVATIFGICSTICTFRMLLTIYISKPSMRGPRCTPRLASLGLVCGLRGVVDSTVHEDKEYL